MLKFTTIPEHGPWLVWQKITQNNNKINTRQKREVCSVNMISMNAALPPSLNGIEKKIKATYPFIDDKYH